MAQTYCDQDDVEAILSEQGVLSMVDDPEVGVPLTESTAHATDAIERAAVRMNFWLAQRYKLSDLASNAWCKWANAVLAARALFGRRGNPVPQSLLDDAEEIIEQLKSLIEDPLSVLPEQPESFDFRPTVSNLNVNRGARTTSPIEVDTNLSTGPNQSDGLKRFTM